MRDIGAIKILLLKHVCAKNSTTRPLRARDFERDTSKKGTRWWACKPDKVAIEQRFIKGVLMVVERRGFQKVYDLTERVLPTDIDTTIPSAGEFDEFIEVLKPGLKAFMHFNSGKEIQLNKVTCHQDIDEIKKQTSSNVCRLGRLFFR